MMPAASDALRPVEWQQACAQRAAIYGWFSRLYAAELTGSDLSADQLGQVAALLQGLADTGLVEASQRLHRAFEGLRGVAHAPLELAADFAHAFLLDAKTGALPYGSCYKNEAALCCGPAEQRMRSFLAQSSLELQADFKEPADHLAVYLAVIVKLIEQAQQGDMSMAVQALDQAAFLQEGLMDWLPLFTDKCQGLATRFDVYPALASLVLAFVQQDLLFLQDVAHGSRLSPV